MERATKSIEGITEGIGRDTRAPSRLNTTIPRAVAMGKRGPKRVESTTSTFTNLEHLGAKKI